LKIALFSDLHLELGAWMPPASAKEADVIILAGDIASQTAGLAWAVTAFGDTPVIYVCGNHELYDADLSLIAEMQQPKWASQGIHFLENRAIEINGVRFLGCTLWSGFDLYGVDLGVKTMLRAKQLINDYHQIKKKAGSKPLDPTDTLALHVASVDWLDTELAKPFPGKTVVITHFAPHHGCVPSQFEGSDLSPYFVTDLSRLMQKHRIALWCYGHTHASCDFMADGDCRIVSNQRGYPGERGLGFRPELLIEL
jgi:predicted phosphodiesterase